jgi:serine/threonine-protein kinase RsbW
MAKRMHREYPSIRESEAQFLDDLAAFLVSHSLDPDTVHRVTLSLSEAFTNALVHGNRWDPGRSVTANIEVNDTEVCADITDEGSGGVAAITRRPRPNLLAESGRGVDLIYRYCEAVEFDEVENGGLRVTLHVPRRKTANV